MSDPLAYARQLIEALSLSLNIGMVPVVAATSADFTRAGFRLTQRTAAFVLVCRPDAPNCRPGVALVTDRLPASPDALLCIVRHELAHVELGHVAGARSRRERERHHDEVRFLLRARYASDDITCEGRSE